MCGITAILLTGGRTRALGREEASALLLPMTRTLVHRGPDGEGFWFGERGSLGHRRLAILDKAGGAQPMASPDGRLRVVFNGEIYNHRALRRELEAEGHRFRSRCDTEVLVHGWLEWGEELPERLQGMFAFVLHDEGEGTTFLARDRLGKKPLFWTVLGEQGLLLLASEMRAFLALPGFPRRIEDRALRELLCLRYVPDPRTLCADIRRLPPASLALHRPGEGLSVRSYWKPPFGEVSSLSPTQAVEDLRERILEAVEARLEADVPLGAFLSGGVDSSGVAAAMVRGSKSRVRAVTVGFAEGAFDERPHARAFAGRIGIDLQEEICLPEPERDLPRLAELGDEAPLDSSAWPTLLLSEAARRHVTVALSGDGGDESFGGYRRHRFDLWENRMRPFLPRFCARFLAALCPKADWLPRPLRWKRSLQNLARDPLEAYLRSVCSLLPSEVDALCGPGPSPSEALRGIYEGSEAGDHMGRVLDLDLRTYLPGDILVKVDRCSMAHSLEVRSPLLDYRVVEAASRLPSRYKLSAREGKKVLKEVFEPWVGRKILDRPKQGFAIPLAEWLRGPLREVREEARRGSFVQAHLDGALLERWGREHDQGLRDRSEALWASIALHLWFERWGRPL